MSSRQRHRGAFVLRGTCSCRGDGILTAHPDSADGCSTNEHSMLSISLRMPRPWAHSCTGEALPRVSTTQDALSCLDGLDRRWRTGAMPSPLRPLLPPTADAPAASAQEGYVGRQTQPSWRRGDYRERALPQCRLRAARWLVLPLHLATGWPRHATARADQRSTAAFA